MHIKSLSRFLLSLALVAPLGAGLAAPAQAGSVAPTATDLSVPGAGQSYRFVEWRDHQLGGRFVRGGNDDWRFRHRRGFGNDRRAFGYGRGYNRGYYRRGYGNAYGGVIAGGVVGLAAGALIGNALSHRDSSVVRGSGAVESCSARFRSYDPSLGTYLGYDGRRHACP